MPKFLVKTRIVIEREHLVEAENVNDARSIVEERDLWGVAGGVPVSEAQTFEVGEVRPAIEVTASQLSDLHREQWARPGRIEVVGARAVNVDNELGLPLDWWDLSRWHGHVRPTPSGVVARCGGPALCQRCAFERDTNERYQAVVQKLTAPAITPSDPRIVITSREDPQWTPEQLAAIAAGHRNSKTVAPLRMPHWDRQVAIQRAIADAETIVGDETT